MKTGESSATSRYWQRLRVLSEHATRDFLSGLLNRTTAIQYIEACLKNMPRNEMCALFVLDLDNFKLVNDTFGREYGDEILQKAARKLACCFRGTDIVGRYGSDEFFALLAGKLSREMVLERARTLCESLQFVAGAGSELRVTVSVGVHIARQRMSFSALYARANASLVRAKLAGRNRFQISEEGMLTDGASLKKTASDAAGLSVSVQTLLENISEGVSLLSLESPVRIFYLSSALRKILHMRDHDEIRLPCELSDIGQVHPDHAEDFFDLLRTPPSRGREVEYDMRFCVKGSHEWRWYHLKMLQGPTLDNEVPTLLVFCTDISADRRLQAAMAEETELLRLVLSQRDCFLWSVELQTRTFTLLNPRHHKQQAGVRLKNFPESIIEHGWVHPASVDRFRKFAGELMQSSATGGCALALRNKVSRNYRWFSVYCHLLPETTGLAPKVIGVIEPLSGMSSQEGFSGIERLWEDLRPSLILYLHANLTRNCVDILWTEGRRNTQPNLTYTQLFDRSKSRIFFPEEAREFLQQFERQALLEAFANGTCWIAREFRRVDGGGTISWNTYTAILSLSSETEDVHVFLFVQNTDLRHERERALPEKPVLTRDGLYDRRTARALACMMMDRKVEDGKPFGLQALMVIRFDCWGRNCQSAACRENSCCDRQRSIAMAAALYGGTSCLVGELGTNRLTLFFPEVPSRNLLRQQTDRAITFVRTALSRLFQQQATRFVCVVVCDNLVGADYDRLLEQASAICEAWQDSPDDEILYFTRAQMEEEQRFLHLSPFPLSGTAQALQDREADKEHLEGFVYECLDAIIMSDSPDNALAEILARIGRHFGADRVYLLSMPVDCQHVIVTSEWCSAAKSSIRSFISGTRLDRLPLVRSCLEKDKPLFVNRSRHGQEKSGDPSGEAGEHAWNYSIFPLHLPDSGPAHAFLCLENFTRAEGELKGLRRLLPYIVRINQKYTAFTDGQDSFLDALTGIANIQAYKRIVHGLTSDKYSSMGVLSLDVPDVDTEDEFQCKSSARTLIHIAGVLKTVFDKKFIFRVGMSEFVMFCPNTTQDVFLGRVLRVQSVLQRRYQKNLRLGYTWARGYFFGERMVRETRRIMQSEERERPFPDNSSASGTGTDWQKHFVVYLQPKVDIRTGHVFSAEALVRGVDDEGTIISPLQFIEAMEKLGSIRDLDLFVLGEVLKYLDDCRQRGARPLPVSVNFSRVTFFNPLTPGAVLAILSRYPDVDPGLIEIEITETAGDVESTTLERTMDHYRNFGLHFALDDFGSRYSNFSMFANVRFDTVKIDRSLTREISYNPVCRSLVGNIARICSKQGIQCVAEGVETQAQVDVLLEEDCSLAQGFYYNGPIPMNDFWNRYQEPVSC